MSSAGESSNLSSSIATIAISDDSSDDSSSYQQSSGVSDAAQKPRNIAVKKGTPISQQQKVPSGSYSGKKWDRNLLEGSTFLADFNPENSRREKNKRYNLIKTKPAPKKLGGTSMYDEKGRIRLTQEDVCDCFDLECPGCHFPCDDCQSQKCGMRCRVNRKWAYEVIEHDGKDMVKTNPLLTTVNYRN